MDWSENNSCIKCDKGGNVLVCSENGCPLAVHEGCLGYPAGLDDAGRFRCPYCQYKQAVVETRKAREYALARKKALLIFMDGSEKGVGENGHDRPKSNGVNVSKSKSNNDGVIDQGVRVSEAEKIGNASESSAGSKAEDPPVKMNEGNGSRAAEEKRVQEEEREASVEEQIQEEQREASVEEEEEEEEIQGEEREASVEEEEIHERNVKLLSKKKKKKKRFTRQKVKLLQEEEEEEEIQEEQREASVEEEEEEEVHEEEREPSVEEEEIHGEKREASADEEDIEEEESEASYASNSQDSSFTAKAKRGLKRSKPVEKEPESARVKSKSLKHHGQKKKRAPPAMSTPTRRSARGSSSAKGTGKALKKELVSPRKSAIPILTSAKPAKRQRLMWTEEEEAALREGVTKYSREEKIPWRKILEESDKFNETRTPEDLRHKWKKRNFLK